MWAISKTLGSRNGHPQMWKGPMAYHRFAQKWDMANLGVSLAGKWMIYLTPERRLCFLFDQASALQNPELSEEVLLEEVLCKSLFPHRRYGQPASTQPLYSELSSSPGVQTRMLWRVPAARAPTGPNLCRKECQIECQYIYLYLAIYLSVCLILSDSVWFCLSVCLPVCLPVCLILSVSLSVWFCLSV